MKEFTKYLKINKSKIYLKLALIFFLVWLFCKGPLRWIVKTDIYEINVFLGSAPNFFGGITLIFWQTYGMSSKPMLSFLCSVAILFLAEYLQVFIDTQTVDVLDLISSVSGCAIAAFVVQYLENKKHNLENKKLPL